MFLQPLLTNLCDFSLLSCWVVVSRRCHVTVWGFACPSNIFRKINVKAKNVLLFLNAMENIELYEDQQHEVLTGLVCDRCGCVYLCQMWVEISFLK